MRMVFLGKTTKLLVLTFLCIGTANASQSLSFCRTALSLAVPSHMNESVSIDLFKVWRRWLLNLPEVLPATDAEILKLLSETDASELKAELPIYEEMALRDLAETSATDFTAQVINFQNRSLYSDIFHGKRWSEVQIRIWEKKFRRFHRENILKFIFRLKELSLRPVLSLLDVYEVASWSLDVFSPIQIASIIRRYPLDLDHVAWKKLSQKSAHKIRQFRINPSIKRIPGLFAFGLKIPTVRLNSLETFSESAGLPVVGVNMVQGKNTFDFWIDYGPPSFDFHEQAHVDQGVLPGTFAPWIDYLSVYAGAYKNSLLNLVDVSQDEILSVTLAQNTFWGRLAQLGSDYPPLIKLLYHTMLHEIAHEQGHPVHQDAVIEYLKRFHSSYVTHLLSVTRGTIDGKIGPKYRPTFTSFYGPLYRGIGLVTVNEIWNVHAKLSKNIMQVKDEGYWLPYSLPTF